MSATCTYLVSSGDMSTWVWPYWHYYFSKYWQLNNGVMDVAFLGENSTISAIAHCVQSGPVPWSDGVRNCIHEHITSKYVILTHEDYFFTEIPDYAKVKQLLDMMDTHNLALVKCCGDWSGWSGAVPIMTPALELGEYMWRYNNESPYLTSHQMSIWDRQFLLSTLRPGWTPWEHELAGTTLLRPRNVPIYTYRGRQPIPYAECVTAGKPRPTEDYRFHVKL